MEFDIQAQNLSNQNDILSTNSGFCEVESIHVNEHFNLAEKNYTYSVDFPFELNPTCTILYTTENGNLHDLVRLENNAYRSVDYLITNENGSYTLVDYSNTGEKIVENNINHLFGKEVHLDQVDSIINQNYGHEMGDYSQYSGEEIVEHASKIPIYLGVATIGLLSFKIVCGVIADIWRGLTPTEKFHEAYRWRIKGDPE